MGIVNRFVRLSIWIIGSLIVFAIASNIWIVLSTSSQILKQDELRSDIDTALILGTSYNTTQGTSNPFFTSRINTAVELYRNNRVHSFVLSGSATEYYNEPKAMESDLLAAGIPQNTLTHDTLGVRTLASIIRCKEVYKRNRVIIVTQRFHAYRALFISNYYNMEAIAVPTDDVNSNGKIGIIMREFFARPLAVVDLYILNSRP